MSQTCRNLRLEKTETLYQRVSLGHIQIEEFETLSSKSDEANGLETI